jgi:hypothetical protein
VLPRVHSLSRFLAILLEYIEDVRSAFHASVETTAKFVPDFGKQLAVDSKAIRS